MENPVHREAYRPMWPVSLIILIVAATALIVPRLVDGDDILGLIEMARGGQEVSSADDADETGSGRTHKIQAADNGQYMTEARLNGRFLDMLVDTGASAVVLPERQAKKIGIFPQPSDYNVPVQTANGATHGAHSVIRELKLGPIRLKNIDMIVLKDEALSVPLLGMSALGRLKGFDISNDTMILVQ
ncbi:retropepsin-like aspartic protease family protein [Roseibium polysiphoniae]|nr:TIGR02281 family clan AA aspartic protease [Roseibium polysiphoniae]